MTTQKIKDTIEIKKYLIFMFNSPIENNKSTITILIGHDNPFKL